MTTWTSPRVWGSLLSLSLVPHLFAHSNPLPHHRQELESIASMRPSYSEGWETVAQLLDVVVPWMQQDGLDPHTTPIVGLESLGRETLQAAIAALEEQRSENLPTASERLAYASQIAEEFQKKSQSQSITHAYWVRMHIRLSILLTPPDKRKDMRLPPSVTDEIFVTHEGMDQVYEAWDAWENEGERYVYTEDIKPMEEALDMWPLYPGTFGAVVINAAHRHHVGLAGLITHPVPPDQDGTSWPESFLTHDFGHYSGDRALNDLSPWNTSKSLDKQEFSRMVIHRSGQEREQLEFVYFMGYHEYKADRTKPSFFTLSGWDRTIQDATHDFKSHAYDFYSDLYPPDVQGNIQKAQNYFVDSVHTYFKLHPTAHLYVNPSHPSNDESSSDETPQHP